MNAKQSVSTKIAHYLVAIIIFAGIITTFALGIIASSRSDAEQINISGSLRFQTYRIWYGLKQEPNQIDLYLREYRRSLHSPALMKIDEQFLAPKTVKHAYHDLISAWREMEQLALRADEKTYRENLPQYVGQVDKFVHSLQEVAEYKVAITTAVILSAMLLIIGMVGYVIWYTRRKVVSPLQLLTRASVQVQMRQFKHIPLDTQRNDELGSLAKAFTQMSGDLYKLYAHLEERINEKTQKLTQINRTLAMLYHCSQTLTASDIDRNRLLLVMQNVMAIEHLIAFKLTLLGSEDWNIELGNPSKNRTWQEIALGDEKNPLGVLSWQAGLPCPDPRTMDSIAQLLSRSLYFDQSQRQQQQLLLMEERSIIARELHDSLAQVLSYLQIQLTLLKHHLHKDDEETKSKSLAIINDFEQALSDGYTQLRELLATFRLTVQEANLKLALEQVIESLRTQTDIPLCVDCTLPSQIFNAQQLVHVLQIVREATLNAIKHSQGSLIEIVARTNDEGEREIVISDNGVGIPSLDEPEGHYGLRIMEERSRQLNAQLTIKNRPTGGTEVRILL
ncbi:nitrate/nitrite two-component system sensor histidine kinase NarQ [Actinobacillus porcinus]|uniref:Sensor protein n=1 Tax=Actinobacillus porcinus TaxID=51048 RepID=A0ABY6TLY4_9PAST|nr:nitrate/nitrite two-component system sensor histidine kinase NarQ [Actinobacillus porcinus]VFY93791.1 nitrate/nitrite sensor protein NarQ [Actinobacillus porcinus]VTU09162.1 nitrate/nitrite sensor protein NarQ [Actinobacillus porcinus]